MLGVEVEIYYKILKKKKIKKELHIDFSKEMILKAKKTNKFKDVNYFELDMTKISQLHNLYNENLIIF